MFSSQYAALNSLIQFLSDGTNVHICIHDISGILNEDSFGLSFHNHMHSLPICSAAKSTSKGLNRCISCKNRANSKAVSGQKRFYGFCPNGLFEIAHPVCVNGKTLCIIYIGNLVWNKDDTKKKIQKACKLTHVPEEWVLSHLDETQLIDSVDKYCAMSDLIESYIQLLYLACPPSKLRESKKFHWAVEVLKSYIDHSYDQDINLEQLAKLHYINDKYIGRLFKKQLGLTFHEYLNEIRLNHAELLLQTSEKNITQIALDVGFQNIPYFNRVFLKKHGISPSQFRRNYFMQ